MSLSVIQAEHTALSNQNKQQFSSQKKPKSETYNHSKEQYGNEQPRSCNCNVRFCIASIQPKLKVSQPDDPFELEADRVAEQVMNTPTDSKSLPSITGAPENKVNRKCGACAEEKKRLQQEEDGKELQISRKASIVTKEVSNQTNSEINSVISNEGQPLDTPTKEFMESRFGYDFSNVRIHNDERATKSAQSVNALAYTAGNNIVFGEGQYMPTTTFGQQLLAHELTHVIQQKSIGANTSLQSFPAQRKVKEENVTCHESGLTNPNLSGPQVVAAIQNADQKAINLAFGAELRLGLELAFAKGGMEVDKDFDSILQEELGLTLTNPRHFPLIEQQKDRFARVRKTLESGYLGYYCRGSETKDVPLVGCDKSKPEGCQGSFAYSCPANRLVVLCQTFWDIVPERPGTILHEPFHIWFDMANHEPTALKRADASCFEAFARRLSGEKNVPMSCIDHTRG